jgi:1,4-dihydroxy-2-naphthoyl-CoA synthase
MPGAAAGAEPPIWPTSLAGGRWVRAGAIQEDPMTRETLVVEQDGAILTVTLNRPKQLNTINRLMVRELDDLARSLEEDRSARVVIVTGAGTARSWRAPTSRSSRD